MINAGLDSDRQVANRKAALRWGGFVVGLLSLQVIGGVFAILLATGDESVAIVPNYHQKALHWDEQVAIATASSRLGWIAQMDPTHLHRGAAGLRIRLRDQGGQLVEIEAGEIEIYRHIRAADVRRVKIPGGSVGAIDLDPCFDAGGLWQVALDVSDAQGNRFVDSQQINVVLSADGAVNGPPSEQGPRR